MTDGWFLLTAGALSGAFALIGSRFGSYHEKRNWERAERKAAYAEFLRESDSAMGDEAVLVVALASRTTDDTYLERMVAVVTRSVPSASVVAVLGPEEVYDAARTLLGKAGRRLSKALESDEDRTTISDADLGDEYRVARDAFIAAARRALDVSEPRSLRVRLRKS